MEKGRGKGEGRKEKGRRGGESEQRSGERIGGGQRIGGIYLKLFGIIAFIL
jgi:hypothetical protein